MNEIAKWSCFQWYGLFLLPLPFLTFLFSFFLLFPVTLLHVFSLHTWDSGSSKLISSLHCAMRPLAPLLLAVQAVFPLRLNCLLPFLYLAMTYQYLNLSLHIIWEVFPNFHHLLACCVMFLFLSFFPTRWPLSFCVTALCCPLGEWLEYSRCSGVVHWPNKSMGVFACAKLK